MTSMNKKEEKKEIKGMTITGQTRIWKKTFSGRPTYSISIGRKKMNSDQYDHAYMGVFFADKCRPSVDLDDGGYDITVKNAFLTVTKKGDSFVPALMITDWE